MTLSGEFVDPAPDRVPAEEDPDEPGAGPGAGSGRRPWRTAARTALATVALALAIAIVVELVAPDRHVVRNLADPLASAPMIFLMLGYGLAPEDRAGSSHPFDRLRTAHPWLAALGAGVLSGAAATLVLRLFSAATPGWALLEGLGPAVFTLCAVSPWRRRADAG